jgi:crotonobetainyl-CoA:carnitine CoA-transferase CaiB-like acyl-CoA transferase
MPPVRGSGAGSAGPPPIATATADPVTDWARSGVVALTGHPHGPPLVPPGRAATVAGALADRLAEATAGRLRLDGGRLLAERAAFTGHTRRGRISAGGGCRLLATADGWAAVSCVRPDDPALLGALIEAELPADPWPALAAWLRAHPGAELAERAELLGVAAAPLADPTSPRTATADASAALAAALSAPSAVPATRPAAGLLVVDFSALWAGPLCAHLLGLAGARVVKVETPQRPDGARRGDPAFYRLLHAGHRSVVLDPADAAGRRALSALVAAADVVIEASRPRALARWGLDAGEAVADGRTWISITAAGRCSDRVGFGDDLAAAAGLVARDGDGEPVFCGDAIADPLAGITAAVLALTAPPRLWDLSMADLVRATLEPGPPAPAPAARRGCAGRWVLDTAAGPVAVADPTGRTPVGRAPGSGADTAAVLGELGIAAR